MHVDVWVLRDGHLVERLWLGQLRRALVRSVDANHVFMLLVWLWSPRHRLVTEGSHRVG